MPRIRRGEAPSPARTVWRVGKYIRLSRDDGNEISESVVNQDKILNDEIPGFFPDGLCQVVDTYIDDGTSGTTDLERRDFQRMVGDIRSGRINCVVVKNLSRAFRNSANQGRFLEEFIPLYHTRFISLYQPRIDTLLDPEVVHSLEVSITGFLNEQYAYKTSADVRRTFRHKRERGEFIGAFAPYGYAKDPADKNALIVDGEAAQVVRNVFRWFVTEGMSKAGIARRLNGYGIPNPAAYKRAKGLRYENPQCGNNDGLWSPSTVARMLQNPLYIGVMRQGRQRVVSYKVHKRVAVPEEEWFVVEDAVPAILDRALFEAAQRLHRRDTRAPPGRGEVYLFSGLVRCAGCGKGMARHTAKGHVYYQCRTYQEKSRDRCAKHSIRLDVLERAVLAAVQGQLALAEGLPEAVGEAARASGGQPERLNAQLKERARELERVTAVLDSLYVDWRGGEIDGERYRRVKARCEERAGQLRAAVDRIRNEEKAAALEGGDPELTAFLESGNVDRLSRGLLVELVRGIYVHGRGHIEIEFDFAAPACPEGCG